jgi:hypothetical protein
MRHGGFTEWAQASLMVLFDWWAHSAGPSVMVLLQVRHTMGDGGSYVMGWPKPLTKSKFLEVVHQAAVSAGLEKLQGHGIRIGSTLEYLLRGVPFDVVKVKGRWASDAFLVYLRKHAQILAPYMQDRPEVHEAFVRIAMPVRR